jgi:predicted HTH domain antitoxin
MLKVVEGIYKDGNVAVKVDELPDIADTTPFVIFVKNNETEISEKLKRLELASKLASNAVSKEELEDKDSYEELIHSFDLDLAINEYRNGEISLGKAAEIAGLCWEDMKDVLIKNGIEPRLGPQTIEEARQDYLTIRRFLDDQRRDRE